VEKKNGRCYGSCWECGHSVEIDNGEEPVVFCVPRYELVAKYDKACAYLIPRCEHVLIKREELKADGATVPKPRVIKK